MNDSAGSRMRQRIPIARYLRLLPELFRFIGTGLLAFPIGLGVSALCHEVFGWREEIAAAAAVGTLLLINFALGRAYVFRSTGRITYQLPRFVAIALLMRGAEYSMFYVLFASLHVPYLVAITASLTMSSLIKFYVYRTWVFPGLP
jgi:putative flippase GtrA